MSERLEEVEAYAKYVVNSGCFDSIVEIKKAIRNKDEAAALMHLGQLREQLWIVRHYVESLESNPAILDPSRPRVCIQTEVEHPLLAKSAGGAS